jgi:hypothetical protein
MFTQKNHFKYVSAANVTPRRKNTRLVPNVRPGPASIPIRESSETEDSDTRKKAVIRRNLGMRTAGCCLNIRMMSSPSSCPLNEMPEGNAQKILEPSGLTSAEILSKNDLLAFEYLLGIPF